MRVPAWPGADVTCVTVGVILGAGSLPGRCAAQRGVLHTDSLTQRSQLAVLCYVVLLSAMLSAAAARAATVGGSKCFCGLAAESNPYLLNP
jgi:hypothetical protein